MIRVTSSNLALVPASRLGPYQILKPAPDRVRHRELDGRILEVRSQKSGLS